MPHLSELVNVYVLHLRLPINVRIQLVVQVDAQRHWATAALLPLPLTTGTPRVAHLRGLRASVWQRLGEAEA